MPRTLTIPSKEWAKVMRVIELQKWINEDEAAKLLGVTKKTMQNKVSTGEIPDTMYSVGVSGKRFYDKEMLMGLQKS